MRAREGLTRSMWYEGVSVPRRPGPGAERAVEVCVVGAGIAGLTTAYLLANEGKRVVVLDEGPIGSGQTGRTSAHLVSASDEHFAELEHAHGERGARLFHESHAAAIDRIESIVATEGIACDFARIPGYLLAGNEEHRDALERELEAAVKTGIDATWLERIELGGRARGPCIRYARQARLHPMRYLVALAEAAERAGATIYEGVRVDEVHARDGDGPPRVELPSGQPAFLADAIVVATNTPGPLKAWAAVYLEQAAYRSYVIGLHVPARTVEDALLWDTLDPYHYVRVVAGKGGRDILVVGGEDHRTGQLADDADPFAAIEAWAREMYPMAQDVAWRWSGQIQEPADGPAFIGRVKGEGLYVITGDSGMGLTHGTLGAMLVTDLVMGRKNPWAELYDPERKPMRSIREVAKEVLVSAKQWLDLVTPGEVKDESDIAKGQGAIMRSGMTKLAVYRDDDGTVKRCSAICPHLKAVVRWNAIEKSWDCPAHGSRFACTGALIMGPAVNDLPPA